MVSTPSERKVIPDEGDTPTHWACVCVRRRQPRLITVSSCHVIHGGLVVRGSETDRPSVACQIDSAKWPAASAVTTALRDACPRRDTSAPITDRRTNEKRQTDGRTDSIYRHKRLNQDMFLPVMIPRGRNQWSRQFLLHFSVHFKAQRDFCLSYTQWCLRIPLWSRQWIKSGASFFLW